MSSGVSETPPARREGRAGKLLRLLRDPRQIPSAVRTSAGYRLSPAVKKLVTALGPHLPAGLSYGLTGLLYGGSKKYVGETVATVAFATSRFNSLTVMG